MIYSTRLIGFGNRWYMQKTLLALFLVFSLFPISTSFSQVSDTDPTLGIVLTSFTPYNYVDENGNTIIIGEVENTKSFPVTGVKIWAGFYNELDEQPLESVIGTTLFEVIPPFSKSPYIIKSVTPDPAITSVSVNLLGFNSSPQKQDKLELEPGTLQISNRLSLSGTITNNGVISSTDTKIHLISYDSFVPPRVLGIETIVVDGELDAGASADFEFDARADSRASIFKLAAESNNFLTPMIDVSSTTGEVLTKLVTINDISITDTEGNFLSDVFVDSTVNVQSTIWLQYSEDQEIPEQPYIYYVQIKQSGEQAYVEFIGKAESSFLTPEQHIPQVEWTPQNEGLYFIETFVWDPVGVPLASKGPISLVLVK